MLEHRKRIFEDCLSPEQRYLYDSFIQDYLYKQREDLEDEVADLENELEQLTDEMDSLRFENSLKRKR